MYVHYRTLKVQPKENLLILLIPTVPVDICFVRDPGRGGGGGSKIRFEKVKLRVLQPHDEKLKIPEIQSKYFTTTDALSQFSGAACARRGVHPYDPL